jgi:hypothetical protein
VQVCSVTDSFKGQNLNVVCIAQLIVDLLQEGGVCTETAEKLLQEVSNMSYQHCEIETSQKQLQNIFKQINDPLCLLGGWESKEICKNSRISFE